MPRKFRKIGNNVRACYLKVGDVIALKAEPSQITGWHFAATNARDAIAVEIVQVIHDRRGGRLTYRFECKPVDGTSYLSSRAFFGQNAIPAPIFA